jgi:hypothetical protein
MHVSDQVEQALSAVILGAVGNQCVALANAVREDPSAPEAVPVAGGVFAEPGTSSGAIRKFKIAAPWNVLRFDCGHEEQRTEHPEN